MKESAVIQVLKRAGRNKPEKNRLRSEGYLMGNVYGKNMEPIAIAVKKDEFRKTLNKFGRNSVFTVEVDDGESITAMVKEIQVGPYGLEYGHIDLQQVSLTEEVEADVAIRIVGIDFVEIKGLIVNRQLDSIQLIAFPQNIPDSVEVDVEHMEDGDAVSIADLVLAENVRHEYDPEDIVLTVNEPRIEEEPEEDEDADAEVSVEAEVIGEEDSTEE